MRTVNYVFLVLLIGMFACNKDKDADLTCNTDNPLEDIAWLKVIRDNFQANLEEPKQQIIQYNYNDRDVFEIVDCFQCADGLVFVYDCEQNVLCEFGGIDGRNTCPDFEEKATNRKVLYEK